MFGNIEEKEAQHHTEGGMGAVGNQLEYSDGIDNVSKDLPEEGALAVRRMTPTEKAEALAMAQVVDSGVSYRSLRGMTLLAIMFSCLICGTDVAIDANAMSAINTMEPFLNFFGLKEAEKSTGIVFGIYTIGGVSAFLLNTTLPDFLGRRRAMAICNTVVLVGIILTSQARSMSVFMLGRYFMGLGAVSASAAARSYIAELAPVSQRGLFLGSYNAFQTVGSIFITGIAIPMGKVSNQWSWRGLLLMGLLGPFVNVICSFFIPESPRWLYARGRKEEAVSIIAKYHSALGTSDSPLVQLEVQEIAEEIEVQGGAQRWWDLRSLFSTRANRYRMGMAAMVGIYGQTLGPATYYFALLLLNAGITDTNMQRILNFVYTVITCLAAGAGAASTDRLGRRPMLIFGTASSALGLFVIGGLLSRQTEKSFADAGIALVYVYGLLISFTWQPLNNLYPAEIMTFDIRARGLAFQALCTQSSGLISTFGVPAALVALNYKLYFIYGAWNFVGLLLIWAFLPETKGIPLEQMQDIFEAEKPKRIAAGLIKAQNEKRKGEIAARREAA